MSIKAKASEKSDGAADLPAGLGQQRVNNWRVPSTPERFTVGIAVLLTTMGAAQSLELGEAVVRSGLGRPLQVEIPYRLAGNERIASNCVSIAPPRSGAGDLPVYTQANRIVINATHIQVFGRALVRDPLMQLDVRVQCGGAPNFVRSYVLLIDPAVPEPAELSVSLNVAETEPVDQSAQVETAVESVPPQILAPVQAEAEAQAPTPQPAPRVASPRAQGIEGVELVQGQSYLVLPGDTLSGIATRIVDRPGTIWETVDVVFEANQDAFVNGNRDLLQAGQSILIPVLGDSSSLAEPAVSAVPAISTPSETELPTGELQSAELPSAELSSAEVPEEIPQAAAEPAPQVADVPTVIEADVSVLAQSAATASIPQDTSESVSDEVETRGWSASNAVFVAIGAGMLLLLALLFSPIRKRNLRNAARALDTTESEFESGDTTVVNETLQQRLPESLSEVDSDEAANKAATERRDSSDPGLSTAAAASPDLDTGAPRSNVEAIEWFDEQPPEESLDSTTLVMGAESETDSDESSEKPKKAPWNDERNTQTMTLADLDLIRQDYEAELTMTQQSSQALSDAVDSLRATDAALAAGEKSSLLEDVKREQAMADEPDDETEILDSVDAARAKVDESELDEETAILVSGDTDAEKANVSDLDDETEILDSGAPRSRKRRSAAS